MAGFDNFSIHIPGMQDRLIDVFLRKGAVVNAYNLLEQKSPAIPGRFASEPGLRGRRVYE